MHQNPKPNPPQPNNNPHPTQQHATPYQKNLDLLHSTHWCQGPPQQLKCWRFTKYLKRRESARKEREGQRQRVDDGE